MVKEIAAKKSNIKKSRGTDPWTGCVPYLEMNPVWLLALTTVASVFTHFLELSQLLGSQYLICRRARFLTN